MILRALSLTQVMLLGAPDICPLGSHRLLRPLLRTPHSFPTYHVSSKEGYLGLRLVPLPSRLTMPTVPSQMVLCYSSSFTPPFSVVFSPYSLVLTDLLFIYLAVCYLPHPSPNIMCSGRQGLHLLFSMLFPSAQVST